jgi:hypothetical protein
MRLSAVLQATATARRIWPAPSATTVDLARDGEEEAEGGGILLGTARRRQKKVGYVPPHRGKGAARRREEEWRRGGGRGGATRSVERGMWGSALARVWEIVLFEPVGTSGWEDNFGH